MSNSRGVCFLILPTIIASHAFTKNNYILVGHVFQRFYSIDWFDCIRTCQDDPRCLWYNYKRASSESVSVCELNDKEIDDDMCQEDKPRIFSSGFVFQRLRLRKQGHSLSLHQKGCLSFDFEHGLSGWEKSGTAFNNQPTYGDNPTARRKGQPANQQGTWWIGGYEDRPTIEDPAGGIQGDHPKGALTSQTFKIAGSRISFLIGGGCDLNTIRAELIVEGNVVRKTTGKCNETMSRDSWAVTEFIGRTANVKLIDDSSSGWGHINFDDLTGDLSCTVVDHGV